ncbi:uncharacterized protein METZ01_LOCUS26987 [marine metagenome]|uniref:Uncharacterized protein n=1 Tax=marine metagenome TaxID=408172 RepID=A0A381Q926_9ZZZZ
MHRPSGDFDVFIWQSDNPLYNCRSTSGRALKDSHISPAKSIPPKPRPDQEHGLAMPQKRQHAIPFDSETGREKDVYDPLD